MLGVGSDASKGCLHRMVGCELKVVATRLHPGMHDPERIGEDRQYRIHPAVRHVERTVDHSQVRMPQTQPQGSVTEVAGSYPSGRFRPGAGRCSAPRSPGGKRRRSPWWHRPPRNQSAARSPSSCCTERSLGCSRPLSRATAMPRLSVTEGRAVRGSRPRSPPAQPDHSLCLGSRRRSPRLAASPCGPIRPAWRR